jgi:hypothetical protein
MAIAGQGGRTLMVYLAADTANFKRNMTSAENSVTGFGGHVDNIGGKMANVLGPALLGVGIAAGAMAAKFAVDGVQAFVADEAAAAKLATTLGNLGLEQATTQVESFIDSQQRLTGVADDELRPAFDRLIRSTQDVGTATNALKLAQDIAAGTGKSLESVAAALGKAYDGNTVGLGKLGVGLDAATLRTGNMKEITQALADTFGGQAETAAGTYQGQLNRLTVAFSELQESFGRGFITSLGNSTAKTDELMQAMKDLEPVIQSIGSELARDLVALVDFGRGFQNFLRPLNEFENGSTRVFNELQRQLAQNLFDVQALKDAYSGLAGVASGFGGAAAVGGGGGAGSGGSFGGTASMTGVRENDPSVIRANLAAQWADVLDKLNPKLEENRTASSGSAKATTSIRDAMKTASDTVNTMFQPALDVAQSALDAVQTASYAYAESLKGAITGTISLASAWAAAEKKAEPGEAFAANALTAFQTQIGDATGFAKAIGNLAAQPGVSQALIDQLVAVGQSQGPIAGTVLANEMISSGLVPELANQLQALDIFAGKTGVEVSKKFYDQGTEDAVAMLNGISAEIAAQQKSLKQLGANIGEPIADEVTKQIQRAIRNGLAAGQAEADRQEAAAFALSASSRVTQTAIGQGITAVVRQTDQRTGSLPAAALR